MLQNNQNPRATSTQGSSDDSGKQKMQAQENPMHSGASEVSIKFRRSNHFYLSTSHKQKLILCIGEHWGMQRDY